MPSRLSNLLICNRGVTAIIFAIMLIPLLLVAGVAVDYTQINSDKAQLQEHLDLAVLAGSSAKDVKDPQERIKIAEIHFKGALPPELAALSMNVSFELTDKGAGLKGNLKTLVPTRLMSFFGTDVANLYLTAATSIKPPNRQLDMVFCIDATGSMQKTIDAVRNNARDLEENINSELSRRGYSQFDAIRVRVNFFRDYGPDQGNADEYVTGTWDELRFISNQPPLRRSKRGMFYELPDERDNFHSFLANETAYGGGDEPELGFACLHDAIHSDWAQVGETLSRRGATEKITTITPMIVIWTDANALPLDDEWSERNPYFPINLPRSVSALQRDWQNDRLINQPYKTLVFFGDTNNASPMLAPRPNADPVARWKEIESWDGYAWGGSLTEANRDLVTKLVQALASSPSMPRLTQ